MKIDNISNKKVLAGATAVVALSGFVPAINAASPTATANVGVSVVIQQAITINVGAPVDFGTIILSAATVIGVAILYPDGTYLTADLTGEVSLAGGEAVGTMVINSSAGAVNIAVGVGPTDAAGAITYPYLKFGGAALASPLNILTNNNEDVALIGSVLSLGGRVDFISKPTPGIYNTKSFTITVTDI